jgi:uncharacterized protein (TIGR03790 family)
MRTYFFIILCLAVAFCSSTAMSSPHPDSAAVVILVNKDDPDSVAIGHYYAEARGIPDGNIIELAMPKQETISLRQFVDEINNPLLDKLMDEGWVSGVKAAQKDGYGRKRLSVAIHNIRYLVTVRGVPLRFSNDPEQLDDNQPNVPDAFRHNRASVDSELALLTGPPNLSMTALVPNPYFGGKTVSPTDAQRILKVSRLDGPSKRDVIRLIDRTLEAEETGLMGRAYVDAGGPHAKGDEWMKATKDLLEASHFETSFEASKRAISFEDRFDAPAIYVGWYRGRAYGPWLEPTWSVPPGAIGYHLHSYSATTVRSRTSAWLGAFIAQGYCATWGTVYEPYLEYTHRPQIVLDHLLRGGTFGDAITLSMPALSWQNVAIGDPLYRPFKVTLSEQTNNTKSGPFLAYIHLREMNRIKSEQSPAEALDYGRKLFADYPSLVVAHRLAKALKAAGEIKEAVEVLKIVRFINQFSRDETVLAKEVGTMLHQHGESAIAFKVFEKLLADPRMPENLRITVLDAAAPIATAAGETTKSAQWTLESERLQPPLESK